MKTSRIIRLGVAAAVAGLTLVGTAVPAAQADTASIAVTKIALKPTATYKATGNGIFGVVDIVADADVNITSAKTDVKVNGKTVAVGVPLYQDGIDYNRSWGAGLVSLANIKVTGVDANTGPFTDFALATPANSVRIRYAIDPSSIIRYLRVGKKLTFKPTVRYYGADNKLHSVGKVTIQYKKAGKWKKLKTLKLNSAGKAKYKIYLKKKRSYRMIVLTTNTFLGNSTGASKKI